MPNPIDYSMPDLKTPFQSAVQGYQAGAAIRDDQQQQQTLADQKVQQAALTQRLNTDLGDWISKPGASPEATAALIVKYPQLKDQFKAAQDLRSEAHQAADLDLATRTYAAAQSGDPTLAAKLLTDRATALENSGASPDSVKAHRTMAQMITDHPEFATKLVGLRLASSMGADKFTATFGKVGDEARADQLQPSALAKANAEAGIKTAEADVAPTTVALKNADVQSQIDDRAAQRGIDRDKLTTDTQVKIYELDQKYGQLPDAAAKIVNDSAMASAASEQSASNTADLANRLEQSGAASGLGATVAEALKSATGSQDGVTQLRQEYVRLRATGVAKLLPPGPASDTDVRNAMKGFPSDTADPKELASFLRGMAKIQQYEAASQNAQSEWVGSNQSLGKAKKDMVVDGIKVPAGTTYPEYVRQFVGRKAQEIAAAQVTKAVENRPYMRFAAPPAPGAPSAGTD